MLTLDEAASKIKQHYKDYDIFMGMDYKNYYVFTLRPLSYDEEKDGIFLDNYFSVDKNSGEVDGFTPWTHDDFRTTVKIVMNNTGYEIPE